MRAILRLAGIEQRSFVKKIHNGLLMQVCPAEHIQRQLFWHGFYEKQAILCWEQLIRPGSTVLDIGANAGYYSLVAAPRAGHVVGFEPATALRQQFETNLQLNHLQNVTIVPMAAGIARGETTLFLSAADNTGMNAVKVPENFSGSRENVQVTDIDSWMAENNLPDVHLIKIDVEGAEMDVLTGMTQLLLRSRPILFVEVIAAQLAVFGQSPAILFGFLREKGYTAFLPGPAGSLSPLENVVEADTVIFAAPGSIPQQLLQAGFKKRR